MVATGMEQSVTPFASSDDKESKRVSRWRRASTSVLKISPCPVEIGLQKKRGECVTGRERATTVVRSQVLMEAAVYEFWLLRKIRGDDDGKSFMKA